MGLDGFFDGFRRSVEPPILKLTPRHPVLLDPGLLGLDDDVDKNLRRSSVEGIGCRDVGADLEMPGETTGMPGLGAGLHLDHRVALVDY